MFMLAEDLVIIHTEAKVEFFFNAAEQMLQAEAVQQTVQKLISKLL